MRNWLIAVGTGLIGSLLAYGVTEIWPQIGFTWRIVVIVSVGLIFLATPLLCMSGERTHGRLTVLKNIRAGTKVKVGKVTVRTSADSDSDILNGVEARRVDLGDVDVRTHKQDQ